MALLHPTLAQQMTQVHEDLLTKADLLSEARVTIYDPTSGQARAEVHLRPVNIGQIARLVSLPQGAQSSRQREAYANSLVFGPAETVNPERPSEAARFAVAER